ncbi:polyamine aminopropyltransferase [Pontibacter qinzhouensis]|uniref:S-adenosylmethionine decarboxylase proenzyme n=1 Tax=Pontibacter qinzhouensis TaxID=2603253 RepID=A0A5C8J1N3_9BACT|nr:polyamine aminopropyltransferase [Pontibacter qinzhouensis]TXK27116.1 polyamine aminopropyltransferase [Pontibacter qinzhouensis]
MNALGRHILVEFYDCSPELMNDVMHIENSMVAAAETAGATVINSTFHHFSPYGVSGVVVIQESHLAIHTWPEYGYAAVDLFTCGDSVNPWVSYNYLKEAFEAGHGSSMECRRGQLELLKRLDFNLESLRDVSPKPAEQLGTITRDIWFTERDENIALSLKHSGNQLYKKDSPYQRVEIYETLAYGNMLTLDGMVMCTQKDEYVYHEMITHVPIFSHPKAKRTLVIGGGDGGTVRELLRHEQLEEVTLVEIDELVIEACKLHLPETAVAFDNPRLNLLVQDGIKYINECADSQYDLIIIDSADPVGPGEGLFTAAFYKEVFRCLTPDGLMITQSESPRFNSAVFVEIYETYKQIFGQDKVHCYLAAIPTYPTGTWSFSYSSKGDSHPLVFDREAAAAFSQAQGLKYYNEDIHTAAFALPNFVKDLLNSNTNTNPDDYSAEPTH